MACAWTKALREPHVKAGGLDSFPQLVILVWFNGRKMEVLVDTRCGRTLVQKAEGSPLAEVLQVKCIHRDVKEYSAIFFGCKWQSGFSGAL